MVASTTTAGGHVDELTLFRLVTRGVHSPGAGMRFASLKARYREEYAELKAEAQGQGELL